MSCNLLLCSIIPHEKDNQIWKLISLSCCIFLIVAAAAPPTYKLNTVNAFLATYST